ncbi:MAG: universal stress protein [Solirubrobacteraceae bacterium]
MTDTGPSAQTDRSGRESGPCMVLGYDRSEGARHASTWAAKQLLSGGKLVIVYASRGQHLPPAPLSTQGERHDLGRAILDELMLDGDEALLDIDLETVLSDDDPVSALIDTARSHDARAIVIGTKHHSRLHEALGTVTTELLKTSPVPVITVPMAAELSRQTLTQSAVEG